MDKDKIDAFILTNTNSFPEGAIPLIRLKMESVDNRRLGLLSTINFKNPQTALMLSIFGGPIGIDRLYIGDYLLGVLKTVTCGGILIWAFIDQFLIKKATRENNVKILMNALNQ